MAKTLQELKADNEQVETEYKNNATEVIEDEVLELTESIEKDKEDEEEKKLEPWQEINKDEDEDEQPSDTVPLKTLIKAKKKAKLKLLDKDTELEKLKAENESLRNKPVNINETRTIKRPLEYEFDTEEEYHKALDNYDTQRFNDHENKREQKKQFEKYQEKTKKAIDEHWTRAEDLIEKSGINPEHYKDSYDKVNNAMEAVAPKRGKLIVEDIISKMGKGSETVLFYLGRNEAELAKVQSKLINDPNGIELAFHLGGLNKKLNKPSKKTTRAPAPAKKLNGGVGGAVTNMSAKALKNKYDAAHKNGDIQAAYDIKKEAKSSDVDVSSWK